MIKYIPNMDSLLWSRKCQQTFQTTDDLKRHVADQRTIISHYIGKPKDFYPHDVVLIKLRDRDLLTGWKDFRSVTLAGNVIGFCGE